MGCSHSIIGGSSCIESEDVNNSRKDGRRRRGGEAAASDVAGGSPSPSPEVVDVRASCTKMAWSLGLMLCRASAIRRQRKRGGMGNECCAAENNKSWLLAADARAETEAEAEPQSVHSSFRFGFGSQAEAASVAAAAATTVLLLVNLEDEGEELGRGEGVGEWQRLESLERSISPLAGALERYSYADIRSATRGFSRGRELGRGPLSRVYKGRIGVGRRAVAIKRVEGQDRESAKAFCRELMIASSLRNANIVPLLGFCVDKEGIFLVYKYVSGGSLDHHLHCHERRGRGKVLPWEVRYKVALGVARAVEYLHHGMDKCIIHRDIKPSNVLLSSNRTPKLCDFGLATWIQGPSLPFLCKSVKGTFGYLAPEYFQHGKLSDKTDVYAFGVLLLELITGQKAIDRNRPQGDENLVLWAKPLLQQGEGAVEKLVDPRLKPSSYRWNEMSRMVRAATACVNGDESGRPSIDQVIEMLLLGESTCSDWSVFIGHGCLAGYGSRTNDLLQKGDMRGHLALAMLGVSDTEEDDSHGR
ncbi:probable serine/threonine-protein kinase PBL23 [Phoenix dactylifera]|uniref:Probable serine/threonine-protein kinase PBL23 n=1 Tax=Phoenix dactylifera TaxID=42345 RepID=A0A8B7BNN5_PHODC|nr:probable serine/threonine-protein kinase PBL23 [Phoenix dactylifera]